MPATPPGQQASLTKDLRYSIGTQIPTLLLGLLSAVFLARLLGPDGRGALALFQADVQLLSFLAGMSVTQGLVFFFSSKKLESKDLLGVALLLSAFGIGVCCLLAFWAWAAGLGTYLLPSNFQGPAAFAYLVTAFAITQLGSVADGLLQGSKSFRNASFAALANGVLGAVVFGLAFAFEQHLGSEIGLAQVLILSLLLMLVNATLSWLLCSRRVSLTINLRPSLRDHLRPFLAYVGVVHVAVLVNFLNYRLDVWIVSHYAGTEQLGFYVLAVNAAQLLWLVSNPLCSVLLPYLSSDTVQQRLERLRLYSRLNASLLLVLGATLFMAADPLIRVLYGEAFLESVTPLRLLLPGVLVLGITKVFGTFLAATDRFALNLASNSLGLLATVCGCVILIPRYGIIGACLATNVSYATMFAFTFAAFLRTTGSGARGYLLLRASDLRLLKERPSAGDPGPA